MEGGGRIWLEEERTRKEEEEWGGGGGENGEGKKMGGRGSPYSDHSRAYLVPTTIYTRSSPSWEGGGRGDI